MADLHRQCVLRRGNAYYKALWILSALARLGQVLDVKVTHPYKGHWLEWGHGWTVHEVWSEEPLNVRVVKGKNTGQNHYPAKARRHEA